MGKTVPGKLEKTKKDDKHLRIFVLEAPSPLDELTGDCEGDIVASVAKLIGHEACLKKVWSKNELEAALKHISGIRCYSESDRTPERTICIHLSAHGMEDEENDGVAIGGDDVRWQDLLELMGPVLERDEEDGTEVIFVLSACGADKQAITKKITTLSKRKSIKPPKYFFTTKGDIAWSSAAVTWSLFYHKLPEMDLEKEDMQGILDKINAVGVGPLVYFRWTGKEYLRFPKKKGGKKKKIKITGNES